MNRFVEDFIEEPNQGISCLLDYLKICLNRQQSPMSIPYTNGMSNDFNKFQNANYNQAQRNRDRQRAMKCAMVSESFKAIIYSTKKKTLFFV